MRTLKENKKGITLVSLVITIIVLLILASIATYSGINVIQSSKFTAFTTELKIMQTQVNATYQEDSTKELGDELTENIKKQADIVFTESESGITSQDGYRYWSNALIKELGIEGVEQDFFVNLETRSVVSYEGFQYEGKTYYTLEQLPDGLYNVEYNDKNINMDKPTFDTSVEKISEGKWRVTISNIQYNGYIDKWKVNYQLEGQNSWNTSEDLSFIVNEQGNYHIKIANENVESEEKRVVAYDDSLQTGYQQVEYIESTGTQWIDTGYIRNEYTSKIGITFDSSFYETGWYDLFGDEASHSSRLFLRLTSKTSAKIYETRSGGINVNINNGINHIVIDLINCKAQVNENTINLNSIGNSNLNVYLFTQHYNDALSQYTRGARILNMYIYEEDNMVRNYIPCYRKSDNEIGMYDTVNNKFYTNQGTGTFEKGNDEND